MTIWHQDERVTVHHGDCLDVLRELPDSSIDAVVTDPPYGLEFMGKEWDAPWKQGADVHAEARTTRANEMGDENKRRYIASAVNKYAAGLPFQQWCELWAAEALRVLKPGGHLLAFGGTRTWHRLACAVEDAGFEIRDSIAWMYGSGFPKSMDVSKAIDKAAGAERLVTRPAPRPRDGGDTIDFDQRASTDRERRDTATTPEAEQWQGWGTALKPAFEPIVVARKPLVGTVAANVLTHGTGALNIDGCRIGDEVRENPPGSTNPRVAMGDGWRADAPATVVAGRWPANVVLDESQAAELDAQSGELSSGLARKGDRAQSRAGEIYGKDAGYVRSGDTYGDSGGASRFFYVAKAAVNERPASVSEDGTRTAHPTVKPIALMRWLVRLVTPPGGVVLEPFAGSGTTVAACILEGFECVAIEREPDYLPLIAQRIANPVPSYAPRPPAPSDLLSLFDTEES